MTELKPFEPPWWAKGGHAQTILGRYWSRCRLPGSDERVEVDLKDGDRLVILVRPAPLTQKKPNAKPRVVYLFHGLGGSTDSDYIPRIASLFEQAGFTVVMANHRGCGPGAGLAASPYHSGRAEDLAAVISYGRTRFPDASHLAIGFSLSGNALLLLLGARPRFPQPDFAITVNAPIDLARASLLLSQGFNRLYDFVFVQDSRREVAHRRRDGLLTRPVAIPWYSTLREVDDLYTAPFGGFKNALDYYARCSAGPHLGGIKVPTIALTAADDPFVDVRAYREARPSSLVQIRIEKGGGHMGYLSARPTWLQTRHWLDAALLNFTDKLGVAR